MRPAIFSSSFALALGQSCHTPPQPQNTPSQLGNQSLRLSFVNHLDTAIVAYVTGFLNDSRVFVDRNGGLYHPQATGPSETLLDDSHIAIPLGARENGSSTDIVVPTYLHSARVWFGNSKLHFSMKSDDPHYLKSPSPFSPNDPDFETDYGFAESDWREETGLVADITFVDFAGLPIGIEVESKDESKPQTALGLNSTGVERICHALQEQSKQDGMPWSQQCISPGLEVKRVISPRILISQNESAFDGYFDQHLERLFSRFEKQKLSFPTTAGLVNCSTDHTTRTMHCDDHNRSFSKPTSAEIFGCAGGPFELLDGEKIRAQIIPRFCAGLHRGTLLTSGVSAGFELSNVSETRQTSASPNGYYPDGEAVNVYSKIVHQYAHDHRGYGFSYDDNEDVAGANVAGVLGSRDPEVLRILVGGYDLGGH